MLRVFFLQVRREKPPYLRTQIHAKTVKANSPSTSATPARAAVSENELDHLMELDIIRAVVAMGFPQDKVRAALCRKLVQTGLPFFSLEPCIEAVLQYMEEETRLTLQEASAQDIECEAAAQQAAKMQALQPENQHQTSSSSTSSHPVNSNTLVSSSTTASSNTSSTSVPTSSTSASIASASVSTAVSSVTHTPVSNSSSLAGTSGSSTPISTLSSSASLSSVSASSSILPSVPPPQQTSGTPSLSTSTGSNPSVSQLSDETQAEVMEIDDPAAAEVLTQPMDVITEADEIMGMAEVALKPPTSGPSLLDEIEKKNKGQASGEKIMEDPTTSRNVRKLAGFISTQSCEYIFLMLFISCMLQESYYAYLIEKNCKFACA